MLPYLREESNSNKQYIVNFQGLNLGEGYTDGELSDCKNISSVLAPCVSQRFARELQATYTEPTALHAKAGLLVVDGTKVFYGDNYVGDVSAGRKQICSVGNYIIIFPDKWYYDTANNKFAPMGTEATAANATFTDKSITISDAELSFRVGDGITIEGCTTNPENNKTPVLREINGNELIFDENIFIAGKETNVTLKRKIPDLDVICESNYRLWGAKDGLIYASKYLDPLNFNVFDGLAGDSYSIDVGTDGSFTGAIAYSSHICFFKENTLHKIYGSKPSNYQMVTSQVYGVQAGSERSMCVINETLFYKGVNGIYAYAGGIPELVSDKFGTVKFSEACAATDGERYYISMKRGDKWGVYVYDVLRNIWLKEDEAHCVDMALHEGYVYMLMADGGLYKVDPEGGKDDIEWSITFCPFTETINEKKGYSKFHLRMEMAAGSWLSVETRRDFAPKWEKVYTTHNERTRTVSIPVLPARCDSVEVRISGKGECILRTFIREFWVGSDS